MRAERLRIAAEQLQKSQARVAELKVSLHQARGDGRDAAARAAQLAKRLECVERQLTNERTELHARIAALTDKRARIVADLRDHLAEADRDLNLAREHLMMIDAKLDIVEGAAAVFDARTRALLGVGKVNE